MKKTNRPHAVALFLGLVLGLLAPKWCQAYNWTNPGTRQTDNFTIHYEKDDQDPDYASESYIDGIAEYLEHARHHQVSVRAFRAPKGTTGEDPQRITVEVRQLAGGYALPFTPPDIGIPNDLSCDNRKKVCSHEFHHCVQFAYNEFPMVDWTSEGTAHWMEEDEWDSLNSYLDRDDAFLNNPGTGLLARTGDEGRGCVIFFLYLVEDGGLGGMTGVYARFEALDGGKGWPINFRKAIAYELGDQTEPYFGSSIQEAYKKFARACLFKTGDYGFSDGGAPGLANVAIVDHGVGGDSDIEDYYVGAASDDTVTEKETGTLGSLSARYVYIPRPSALESTEGAGENLYVPTDMHTIFNKNGHNGWGVWVIDDKDDALDGDETQTDVDMSRESPFHKINNNFGKHERSNSEIWRQHLVVTRLDGDGDTKTLKYKVIVVPIFDGTYTVEKGGSKRVKNLSSDNLYKNGDKIEVEVDVSAKAKLRADCSGFDSEYSAGDEAVTSVGGEGNKYKVEYTLDSNNTKAKDMGRSYTLPITCRDVEETDSQDDTSTLSSNDRLKIYLDNAEPKVQVSAVPGWFWVSKEESPTCTSITVSVKDKWQERPLELEQYGVNVATDVAVRIYDGSNPETGTLIKEFNNIEDIDLTWYQSPYNEYRGSADSFIWNGSKDPSGEVQPGTYWIYAEAKDAAGNIGWNHTEAQGIANTVAADPSFIQANRRAPWIIRRIRMLQNQ